MRPGGVVNEAAEDVVAFDAAHRGRRDGGLGTSNRGHRCGRAPL